MKNNLFLVIIVVSGFLVFKSYFGDSDKKEIRNALDEIQENLEFEKTLPPLSVLGRLKKIKSHLTQDFKVQTLEQGKEKKAELKMNMDQIGGIAIAGARNLKYLDFFRLPATIEVTSSTATVSFTVTITGEDNQSQSFKELF